MTRTSTPIENYIELLRSDVDADIVAAQQHFTSSTIDLYATLAANPAQDRDVRRTIQDSVAKLIALPAEKEARTQCTARRKELESIDEQLRQLHVRADTLEEEIVELAGVEHRREGLHAGLAAIIARSVCGALAAKPELDSVGITLPESHLKIIRNS